MFGLYTRNKNINEYLTIKKNTLTLA